MKTYKFSLKFKWHITIKHGGETNISKSVMEIFVREQENTSFNIKLSVVLFFHLLFTDLPAAEYLIIF